VIGTVLEQKYRIERLLGEGGMGAVYAGADERTGEPVAVKVIHAHLTSRVPDTAARFEREARAAAGVDTEHIVRCFDSGTDAATGQPFMVLEYLEGEDLQRVLRRTGPLEPQVALRIAAQACVGLARAHEANIVHRDIKPANLFLAQRRGDEGQRVVKILDFGVAKIRKDPNEEGPDNDGLTRTGSMLGSPLYMSPEQARSVKTVDQRADIWSLGVVLYKALAGRTPFDHISSLGDLVLALWNEPPPPVQQFAPWVHPEIAAILDRMLRVEPSERYQSMTEVLEALRPLLPGGHAIREEMLVPLSEEARQRTAATFFRRFDTRPRMRTDPSPPSRVPTGKPPSESSDTLEPSQPNATSAPGARPSSDLAAAATTGSSGARGPVTQSGLATTDPGSVVAPPPRRLGRGTAIALTFAGLLAGVAAALVLLRGVNASPGAPATSASISPAPAASTPAPTVVPAPETTATAAATAPPSAEPAPAATASTSATAASTPTTSAKPGAAQVTPRPKGSGGPASTATKPGFTDFGDRK
jgi:eukaryotic-like serine/threonine-protein kinase